MGTVQKLPDEFSLVYDSFSGLKTEQTKHDCQDHIRRPFVGTQRKEDTYASIRILKSDGKAAKIHNSSARDSAHNGTYYNFMLQSFEEQRMEKSQIIETFGQSYVYFFGERTPSVRFSGVLMNTQDFNWKSEFLHNYENYFRGTKLIKNNTRAYVRVGDSIFGGYLADMQVNENAETPEQCPFSFSLIVTDRALVSFTSTNRVPENGFGTAINIPYAPRYTEPVPIADSKSGFANVLNRLRAGASAISDSLRKGTDSVVNLLRALSSGRVVSVPDIVLVPYSEELQVRTTSVSLVEGAISRKSVLSGKPLEIRPIYGPALYSSTPTYTGDVRDNLDEYIGSPVIQRNIDEGVFKKLAEVPQKATNGVRLRKFLKDVGMAEYKVDGLSTTARLLGRVGFGLVGSFSATPVEALRRKNTGAI
jgi:hypothetical protein